MEVKITAEIPKDLREIIHASAAQKGLRSTLQSEKVTRAEQELDKQLGRTAKNTFKDVHKAFQTNVLKGLEMSQEEYTEEIRRRMEEEYADGSFREVDGVQLEPFNMKFETAAKIIDAEGNFNFENKRYAEVKDAWMDSFEADGLTKDGKVVWSGLGKRQPAQTTEIRLYTSAQFDADVQLITSNLREGRSDNLTTDETCAKMIDRLFGRGAGPAGAPQPLRKVFKKNVRKSELQQSGGTSDAEAGSGGQKDEKLGQEVVTALTHLQNCGVIDIYSFRAEKVIHLVRSKDELIKKANLALEVVEDRDDDLDPELEAASNRKRGDLESGLPSAKSGFKVPVRRPTGAAAPKTVTRIDIQGPQVTSEVIEEEGMEEPKSRPTPRTQASTPQPAHQTPAEPEEVTPEEKKRLDSLLKLDQDQKLEADQNRRKLTRQPLITKPAAPEHAQASDNEEDDSEGDIF